jgi:hypothetical protein
MVEFSVLKCELGKETVGYKEYHTVIITIPNLEVYEITKESASNFNSRMHYELDILFWNPLISLTKTSMEYIYKIRIDNVYCDNDVNKVKQVVNNIFNTFPFVRKNNKRKQLSLDDNISNKLVKLSI